MAAPALPRRSALLLWLVAVTVAAVLVGWIAYEAAAFDWHPAREEPAGFTPWHWARMWTAFALGVLVVGTLVAAGEGTTEPARPLGPMIRGLGWVVASAAAAAIMLFLADPAAFHRLTVEDGAIEWSSALLLFVGCGFLLLALWRQALQDKGAGRWLHLAGIAGFAALFFLMAMEEISWFQRVIGFETPASMIERNWQGEFNLHNFQTDLTELGLYTGTGIFLVLLPLMRETVGGWRVIAPVCTLLPDRAVAAASAPMLLFTYGHWNLLPVQLAFWAGLAACAVFALRAARQGWSGEARLFGALTVLLLTGQAVFLFLGDRSVAIYDSTEYREWFIALGLAVYGRRQWREAASA